MTDGVSVMITGITVAMLNVLPHVLNSGKLKSILKKVGILEKHMIEVEDVEKIKDKFFSIQTFYVQKMMDENYRTIAVFKTDTFIKLICDYVLTLDFDDINDYTGFHDHLCSASKFNRQRMVEILGEDITNKYYSIHLKHLSKFDADIQKIFFTNGNSKKSKIIAVAIDFIQLFMSELIHLALNPEVDIDISKNRRVDDVSAKVSKCEVKHGNN